MVPKYEEFKELVNRVLISNEVSGISAYTLVKSIGKSGYSFGWCQWDLANGWSREINSQGENVGDFFKKLLEDAVDDNNKALLIPKEVENLLKKAQASSFSSDDIKKIDGILDSTYGREKIDKAYSTYLDFAISEVDRKIRLTSYANVLSSDTFRLLLIDYDNQMNLDEKGRFIQYLQGNQRPTTGGSVKVNGDLGIDDFLTYILNNKQGYNTPNDAMRRFSNVLNISPYTVSTEEEAKGLVYLYHNRMKRASNFATNNAFTSIRQLVNSAKEWLIAKYGQNIQIDGEVYVGLGLQSNAYIESDYNDTTVKYTNKNDLIFGERGDDTLIGGKGSDVLIGGEGKDIYETGNGDIIYDSDHEGKVYLGGKLLQGGKAISGQDNQYKGNYGEVYTLNIDNSLSVTLGSETITIQNYDQQKQSLGIVLGKKIEVTVGNSEVYENAKMMRVYVSINTTLDKDLTLSIMSLQQSATETEDYKGFGENGKSYGEVVIKSGEITGYIDVPILTDDIKEDTENFYITVMPDLTLDVSQYPLGVKYDGKDLSSISFLNAGSENIKDGSTTDVVISIDNASVNEDTGKMTFTIRSNTWLKEDLVIDLMTIDGTAKEGEDYEGVSAGKATIRANTTGTTFSVAITPDKKVEPNETFSLVPTGYTYNGDDLTSLFFNNAGEGTIVNDDQGLKDIEISIGDAVGSEKKGTITFDITLNRELDKELSFGVMSIDGSAKEGEDYEGVKGLVKIPAKSRHGTFEVKLTSDDIPESPETFILSPDGSFVYDGKDLGTLFFTSSGNGIILDSDEDEGHPIDYNPFTPKRKDPLVIDANKDGFISTIPLSESEVYFDIAGNGVKTKTSWIKGSDAILVYDENEDGKINSINEAFGNANISGFDELRNTIDSNNDNKIDRRDILFNRLQLWHDYDQDGSVDEGELKSLKEEGITSIDLNSVQTNINLEGAVLTEASHYADNAGNKDLAADLELVYLICQHFMIHRK